MEPAQEPLNKFVIYSRVVSIQHRFRDQWVRGNGANAVFEKVDMGFYMHLEGSHEVIFMGMEKPQYQPNDHMKITIEKYAHA